MHMTLYARVNICMIASTAESRIKSLPISRIFRYFWNRAWIYTGYLMFIYLLSDSFDAALKCFLYVTLQHSSSRPIITIDRHILMTKITKPITRLLHPLPTPTPPKINQNIHILQRQNKSPPRLIPTLPLAIHHQLQHLASIRRHETHARLFRYYGVSRGKIGCVSYGAEDAAPVGVFAVKRGFNERVASDCGGDFLSVGERGGVDDADADEFRGAFAVADDELREPLGEVCEDFSHY